MNQAAQSGWYVAERGLYSANKDGQAVLNVVFKTLLFPWLMMLLCLSLGSVIVLAQDKPVEEEQALGPVVTAYLGYLRSEQEVVDDRVSRKEISRAYYRRNSNRIRALREMAIRIVSESKNDYLPELEAAAADELGKLFEHPPSPANLRVGEVFNFTLRYLGLVRAGDNFYVFARLDPYEQSELREKAAVDVRQQPVKSQLPAQRRSRPRRVHDRKQVISRHGNRAVDDASLTLAVASRPHDYPPTGDAFLASIRQPKRSGLRLTSVLSSLR